MTVHAYFGFDQKAFRLDYAADTGGFDRLAFLVPKDLALFWPGKLREIRGATSSSAML